MVTEILVLLGISCASFVGTISGFGTSTILVPLLSLFFPLQEVLLFVGIIHWFGNLWKLYFFRSGKSIELLFGFGLAGAVGSFLGARLTVAVSQDQLQRALGAFLLFYSVLLFWQPRFQLRRTISSISLGGFFSGISSGIFGVGGAVRGAFLTAFGLKKAAYLFTAGAIGFIIDSTRLLTYWQQDFRLETLRFTLLLIGIPLSWVGARVAKNLVDYLPEKSFKTVILAGLFLFGLYSLL